MENFIGHAKFDNEIQDAWRDDLRLDSSIEILDSLSALDKTDPPAGLKQKILEIPSKPSWNIIGLSPIRATSLVFAPALALLLVLVIIPRQVHTTHNTPLKTEDRVGHPGTDSTEPDLAIDVYRTLNAGIGDNQNLNILDQDIQDMEEVL